MNGPADALETGRNRARIGVGKTRADASDKPAAGPSFPRMQRLREATFRTRRDPLIALWNKALRIALARNAGVRESRQRMPPNGKLACSTHWPRRRNTGVRWGAAHPPTGARGTTHTKEIVMPDSSQQLTRLAARPALPQTPQLP